MVQRIAAFAATVLLVLSLLPPTETPAQRRRPLPDYLILAQVALHEAGWEAYETGDMVSIWAVLRNGAAREGISFARYAHAYSGRALRGETTRGAWIAQLRPEGDAPGNWPEVVSRCRGRGEARMCTIGEHPPWARYREAWLELLEHARAVSAGAEEHHCSREPHDWGGRMDHERAERIGLIPVNCSFGDLETRNTFYVRPSIVRREETEGTNPNPNP